MDKKTKDLINYGLWSKLSEHQKKIIKYGFLNKSIPDLIGIKSIRITKWDNTKLFPYLDMHGVAPWTLQYIPCKISDELIIIDNPNYQSGFTIG